MQQLRRNSVSRYVSYLLMVALLTPQCLWFVPHAAAQTAQNVPAVAVVPFGDTTGKATPTIMREVTAATALALEDSKEYVVTSTTDMDRELQALRLQPPLSTSEQIRLGQRLHVEKVLVGNLAELSVDCATGRAHVVLRLMLLDIAIGEYLDGAVADITTKPIPGFTGDVAAVTNEALRQAAEESVTKMLSSSVRRGTVELVDDQGNININLGTNDGLQTGSELLVMRPTWQPDVEQVILRRVGVVRVSDVEADMSVCRTIEGAVPTTGDRIYRIYKPVSVIQAEAKSRKVKKTAQMLTGVLLLIGLVAVAGGQTTASPSQLECSLSQSANGETPVVRLRIHTSGTAREKTHAFLIFRAANNPDFAVSPATLIDLVEQANLTRYSDSPLNPVAFNQNRTFSFTFVDAAGDQTDGTLDVVFNYTPPVFGNRYFYRIRRVTDPLLPPGSNPPIAGAQVPAVPSITATPPEILSDPSNACGPVTVFNPPILSEPANGATGLPTSNITFSWQPTTGANEYIVQVFPFDDPDGVRAPLLQSQVIRATGTTLLSTTIRGPFNPQTTFWWRVGARQSSDPEQPIFELTGKAGWLYSEMRSFTTTLTPPPPPGAASTAQPRPIPSQHGGWWGGSGRSGSGRH